MTFAAMLPMLLSVLGGAASGIGGKSGEWGSTYSKGQRNQIDDILQSLKGMKGSQDITQNQNYQTGQDWLQSMFSDPEFFKNFEAPLRRDFEEQTLPGIANRFGGMGSHGSFGGGFQRAMGRAGTDFETNLAAQRGQMQQGAIPQLLGYSQQPFSNYMSMMQQGLQPTNNVYQPPTSGFMGGILPAFAGGAAQGYGQKWGQSMAPQGGGY